MLISMSPAFYETYGRRLGRWFEFTGIRLERGDADLDAFRAGVERIAGGRAGRASIPSAPSSRSSRARSISRLRPSGSLRRLAA